jgi:hypothetical protein
MLYGRAGDVEGIKRQVSASETTTTPEGNICGVAAFGVGSRVGHDLNLMVHELAQLGAVRNASVALPALPPYAPPWRTTSNLLGRWTLTPG